MKKIESGTYKYRNRLDENNDDDDVMYGMADLSDREDQDI